jgi:hypothetical protein
MIKEGEEIYVSIVYTNIPSSSLIESFLERKGYKPNN